MNDKSRPKAAPADAPPSVNLSSPAGKPRSGIVRHEIRDAQGNLRGVHVRRYLPDGSKFGPWWEQPDGTPNLNGVHTADLPLYGSDRMRDRRDGQPSILTEGETATDALRALGYQALATVTGAKGLPSDESLSVLNGHDVVLWPDADEAGSAHMLAVYGALWRARSVGLVVWPDAPTKGADAADATPEQISSLLSSRVQLGVPPKPVTPAVHDTVRLQRSDGPWSRFNTEATVSDVLVACFGFDADEGQSGKRVARAGATMLCIGHDDQSPSMSILRDDRRVYCHSTDCPINNHGRGRDAYDLWLIGEAVRNDQ